MDWSDHHTTGWDNLEEEDQEKIKRELTGISSTVARQAITIRVEIKNSVSVVVSFFLQKALPTVLKDIICTYIHPHTDVHILGNGLEISPPSHNVRVYGSYTPREITWWKRADGLSIRPMYTGSMVIRPHHYWLSHIVPFSLSSLFYKDTFIINGKKYDVSVFNLTCEG